MTQGAFRCLVENDLVWIQNQVAVGHAGRGGCHHGGIADGRVAAGGGG